MEKACDDVLKSVEVSLFHFQKDLGAVSAEIETLQSRSTALNTKLENRKVVEKLLGPAVEEITISPAVVKKISDGAIDHAWIKALEDLEKRSRAVDGKLKGTDRTLAVSDLKPLLEDLTNLVWGTKVSYMIGTDLMTRPLSVYETSLSPRSNLYAHQASMRRLSSRELLFRTRSCMPS